MKRNLAYLTYILKHKYFVYKAGRKLGVPLWQLIIHDWTKFKPSEWKPYAKTFYSETGESRYKEHQDFNQGWNDHQKSNKHHWQYWVLLKDEGKTKALPMPDNYVKEMVADWAGAGRAITGKWEVNQWYHGNKDIMILNHVTREKVEELLKTFD